MPYKLFSEPVVYFFSFSKLMFGWKLGLPQVLPQANVPHDGLLTDSVYSLDY